MREVKAAVKDCVDKERFFPSASNVSKERDRSRRLEKEVEAARRWEWVLALEDGEDDSACQLWVGKDGERWSLVRGEERTGSFFRFFFFRFFLAGLLSK